jgi:hypothetical protein
MSGMESRKFDLREKHLALLFSELHHRIRDLFRRVMQAWDCGLEGPDNRQPLRSEHFPLGARGGRYREPRWPNQRKQLPNPQWSKRSPSG